jgi:hypothetical protein
MSQGYVKKVGNSFYIRYENSTAWIFVPDATSFSECQNCCPNTSLTLWEDPNVACSDLRITHPIDLLSPYFHIHQPAKNTRDAGRLNNMTAVGAWNALCGSPPQANLSSIIEIKIPYDPVFAGTYTFSYAPSITGWRLIESNGRTSTSLPAYSGSDASRQGPFQNKKLISLEQTSTEPTYKGYVEVARSGGSTSNISGVFAFPAHFVFSAISPPTDIDTDPYPTTSGHRAVLGFTVPIRWRKEYFDWIVSDQGGHKVSGSKYSKGWEAEYWIPSTNLSVSGYATSSSGSGTIGLSGITNSPATYNLYDLSTAITGSCSMSFMAADTEWSEGPVPYSGLAHMGFCYRTSASGLPYHEDNVMDLNDFMGIRQVFNNDTINTTRLLGNKQDMEAWITFKNSCRTSGTTCSDFSPILGGVLGALPVPTGYTTISGTCIGSYVNADFACMDNIARPEETYLSDEGVTGIKPLYLGTSDNVYPFVKVNANSGNVYMAGSGQNIFIDYNGPHTLNDFREWINKEFSFVEISGNNNIITNQWPGVDLYWQTSEQTAAVTYPNILFARLIPCDSAAYENPSKGLYILKTYNLPFTEPDDRINLWEAAGQPTAEFLGQYAHDSQYNRYILVTDSNIQIRFTPGENSRWSLGKLVGDTFVEYYALSNTTGGNPTLSDPDYYSHFDDYSNGFPEGGIDPPTGSTWNTIQIPVNCLSLPIGQWDSAGYAGTGLAVSIVDPIPVSYNEGNPC